MRIPSDNPTTIHTARSGALQALGLRPGQSFVAQVISHTPEGLTNLQVGSQNLSLALPSKAQIGIFLKFEFQGGGTKPQITLLGETQNPKQNSTQQNYTSNQQSTHQQAKSNPPTQPSPTKINSTPNTQNLPNNYQPNQTPNSQPQISINIPPAAKAALKLYPSQYVSAIVTDTNSNGQSMLKIGQQQFLVKIPNNPDPGTKLQFQVQISGEQTRLVLTTPPSTNLNQTTPNPTKHIPPNPVQQNNIQATNQSTTAPAQNPIAQAISQAIPLNIAKQDSMAALFTNLASLTKDNSNPPAPILKTAEQLQNSRLNFDNKTPTAQNLQNAIKNSGVFLESVLAQSSLTQPAQTASTHNLANAKTTTQSDLKILLLLFRSSLTKWLGEQTTQIKPNTNRPNPPIKGAIPRSSAPPPQTPSSSNSPQNLGQTLLNQTDAALSRLRLFQMTSLPETSTRTSNTSTQETNFELPFVYNGETNIIRFQIAKDKNANDQQKNDSLQINFSMNLKNLGEVGASVSFINKKVNAKIWAQEKATADSLNQTLTDLSDILLAKGLELGAINVRHGTPKPIVKYYSNIENIS